MVPIYFISLNNNMNHEFTVTLFCRDGCRPCNLVAPDFEREQRSGKYRQGSLQIIKPNPDDDDDDDDDGAFPVDAFPTLALTTKDTGKLARKKDGTPVAPPLIGGTAVKKGMSAFLLAHAPSAELQFDDF